MTLTVLNLHQKTDPKVQQDFEGQGHYDKVKVKLEDRSQKKKIMFLHSKNKASRKGYKGEC